MERFISSAQNPLVKEVKSLKNRKNREEKGLFFVEGARLVEEAFSSGAEISRVFVSEQYASSRSNGGTDLAARQGVDAYILPDKLFKEISDTDNPQGIIAVIKVQKYELEDIIPRPERFFVILDAVRDPGNMGTIIRTADAAGVGGIILSSDCVDIYNPKVLRATMGSVFHIPFFVSPHLNEDIARLKEKGIKVYAAHLKGKTSFYDVPMNEGVAIVIGNEANGISEEIAAASDMLVKIPMPGRSESLNASIAAGLLIYEVVRQRMKPKR